MTKPSASVSQHQKSVTWFTIVGALAALTHYVVAVGLDHLLTVQPAWSNVLGFMLAFPVSYVGHRRFSFVHQTSTNSHALPRFLLVALTGFIANQTLVILGLQYTPLPFWLLLGMVMVAVAVSTYLLSHYWVFKSKPSNK